MTLTSNPHPKDETLIVRAGDDRTYVLQKHDWKQDRYKQASAEDGNESVALINMLVQLGTYVACLPSVAGVPGALVNMKEILRERDSSPAKSPAVEPARKTPLAANAPDLEKGVAAAAARNPTPSKPDETLIIVADDGATYVLKEKEWRSSDYLQPTVRQGNGAVALIEQIVQLGVYAAYLPPQFAAATGCCCTLVNLKAILRGNGGL
jgi:hypothetical protein